MRPLPNRENTAVSLTDNSGWKKVRLSDAAGDCLVWLDVASDEGTCYLIKDVYIYKETLSFKLFKEKFHEMNPDIELGGSGEDMLKEIADVLGSEKNTSASVNGDNDIVLKCHWSEDFIDYNYSFKLEKTPSELR